MTSNNFKFMNVYKDHFDFEDNQQFREPHFVKNYLFSKVLPTPVKNPKLILL